jgi:NADPH:quinone reductase-like Zn-dependent oxidoreductase
MHAALVTSFGQPPSYQSIDPPQASRPGQVVVDVLAAALHPRVRSGAAGKHYASGDSLPMVPGIDGVGRLPDGQRAYFLTFGSDHGSMAEQTVVQRDLCFPMPSGADDVTVAAGVNPAMSSWVALRCRAGLQPGQEVLVLGATGSAGRIAVQVARHLGAARVVGIGRDPQRLAELDKLGADAAVPLSSSHDDLATATRGADVVIDYLWGTAAEKVMTAALTTRPDPSRLLTWVHIGAMAGPSITLPSVALRSRNLVLMGSGQGSLPPASMAEELPAIIAELASGTLTTDALALPLSDVETAWNSPASRDQRVVFIP